MSGKTQIIGKIDRKTRIYRIFRKEYFFNLFSERENVLVRPKTWEDPFENVILNAEVRTANGEKGRFGFHDEVYGQCWTLHTASDAMWRIYSEGKDAIRVRTTVGHLLDSLGAANSDWAHTTCFIGKVDYMSETKLRAFAGTIFRDRITPDAIARSLLIKRHAYKHENEVRLIFIEPRKKKHPNGLYRHGIDPGAMFDQAMADPRLSYEKFLGLKQQIVKRTELTEKQVKRSLLYREPEGFVVEIP